MSMLVTRTRRLDLAEDALSEAFARASARWPSAGVPDNPGGWLYTTASRLVAGRSRAEAIHGRKAQLLAVDSAWVHPPSPERLDELEDERLALILLCCHPALHPTSRSALALRLVIGTSTAQIARLFIVPQPTMPTESIGRGGTSLPTSGTLRASRSDSLIRWFSMALLQSVVGPAAALG